MPLRRRRRRPTRRQPAWRLLELGREVRVEQQVRQLRVLVERLLDLAEERAADDAAAAPHQGDRRRCSASSRSPSPGHRVHQGVALGVGDDLAGVEGHLDVVDELVLVAVIFVTAGPASTLLAATRSSFWAERQRAKTASAIRVSGMPEVGGASRRSTCRCPSGRRCRGSGRPAACSCPGRCTPRMSRGDLDQVAVEHALVPLGEDLVHVGRRHARAGPSWRWYASQMSCMSPYSMPLWTILT